MKTTFISIILLFVLHNYSYCQSVLYGQRKEDNGNLSLYFDKEGAIYPEYYIDDTSLRNADSSLNNWYKRNPQIFKQICKQYELDIDAVNDSNLALLQDAIINQFIIKSGIKSESVTSLTFLIHGFRKPLTDMNGDQSSIADYKELEESLNNLSIEKTKFVEIYWDGNYLCCIGKNIFKNKKIFKLFEKAQINAVATGNNLRNILDKVNFEKVNVVTHSLGALVAVQSLFNYRPSSIKTTSSKNINICLIAPAIPGEDIFNSYYNRNTSYAFKEKDNYKLAVVYNENDFILQKKFHKIGIDWGPGPYKYGNTTLGCNYSNEAIKLKSLFEKKYQNSYIELINLSKAGACHYLGNGCYSKGNNLESVVHFLNN